MDAKLSIGVPLERLKLGDNNKSSSSNWEELHESVMALILDRLDIIGLIRAAAVCKHWRSLILQNKYIQNASQVPWILLDENLDSKQLSFLISMCNETYHSFHLPKLLRGGQFCGSSHGWLAICKVNKKRHMLFLFNPISGVIFQLPPFATFLDAKEYHVDDIKLSSEDPLKCTIAVMLSGRLEGKIIFALCKIDEESWAVFQLAFYISWAIDLLFVNDELFILYDDEQPDEGEKTNTRFCIELGESIVSIKGIPVITVDRKKVASNLHFEDDDQEIAHLEIPHLMEFNSEVFVVHQIMTPLETISRHNEENHNERFKYYQMGTFQVHKITQHDGNSGGSSFVTSKLVDNMQDQVLFLDCGVAYSISANNNYGLRGNCIYSLDPLIYPECHKPMVSRESGIYCLGDGKIKRNLPSVRFPGRMSWFKPSIKLFCDGMN